MNDDSDRRSRIVRARASKRRARLALTGMLLVFVGLAVILAIEGLWAGAGIAGAAGALFAWFGIHFDRRVIYRDRHGNPLTGVDAERLAQHKLAVFEREARRLNRRG